MMRLTLYSSVARRDAPNLVGIQDEHLDFLPTVLVCPFRLKGEQTDFRIPVEWDGSTFLVCTELARPIRRTALRQIGHLDSTASQLIMQRFLSLLAR